MAKLQATVRALAPNVHSLGELGKQINKIFCRDGLPNRFASLIYLEIAPDSDEMRILNAGHLPPILLHENSQEEIPRGESALGIMPDSDYKEQFIELQPDDMFIVYSDGLTEARNEQNVFFGFERLMNLLPGLKELSAETAGKRLISEVDQFYGEANPSDDLSLIILKRVS